jgi:hypothetical protein
MFLHFRSWNRLSAPGYLPVSRRRPDVTDVTEADGDEADEADEADEDHAFGPIVVVAPKQLRIHAPNVFKRYSVSSDFEGSGTALA